MTFKCRLGYLAIAKKELYQQLESVGSDLSDYFSSHNVMITEKLDYEEYFEGGWKSKIIDNCKTQFIKETVFDLEFTKEELVKLFGQFSSEVELFDRWWVFEKVDVSEIPTNWK